MDSSSVSISTVPSSSQKKLKFLLVSTHCQQYTGYSKVSWGILKELAKNPWLAVTHFGFQKFPQQQFQSGYRTYPSNVRVIDATHQDLEQRVKEGVFREDLFHRLNVIRLRLPALRERREDVQVLTKHFLLQSAQQLGVEAKRISEQALEILSQFNFPGNVRQLENICHWLTVMAPGQDVHLEDLPPELRGRSATTTEAAPVPAPAVLSPVAAPASCCRRRRNW